MDLNINGNNSELLNKKNRAPLIERALFSDGTRNYRIPNEPMPYDKVRIRFRTAKDNVDQVALITTEERKQMEKVSSDSLFDYYEASIQVGNEKLLYCFEIDQGDAIRFYNRLGVVNEIQSNMIWQGKVSDVNNDNFSIIPGFKTPDWAKGAVFYQIFVDRFCNGDTSNDVKTLEYSYIGEGTVQVNDWNKYPATMGVREFYGGDLKGVMNKLDYLQNLGIEVIYLNPIFVSPSNHKYDIQDYDYIDPHFGVIKKDDGNLLEENDSNNEHATRYISRVASKENLEASNQLFIELVEEIHKRGMKIILDGVFNHCGSFNKWLDKEKIYTNREGYEPGAYVDENSPYKTFFKFREEKWPYNYQYDGWWGHDTLPKLNYEESPKLYEYIMQIARKWVSPPFNVDGWRLDVAADLGYTNEYNHKFWKDFRKNVKEANPQAIILAEHYGDPSAWLQGDEWDTVMNYDAFMEPLTWFLTGVEKHSDEYRPELLGKFESFSGAMKYHMARFTTQSLQVAMNELSNHDHSRFLTRTNRKVGRITTLGPKAAEEDINKGIFRVAVVIQMTWPGAPTIYYGDEAGVCGFTDPDNRRTYPWGREDKELIRMHKELITIHKNYQALKTGSFLCLGGGNNYLSYGRFDEKDKIIIAVNNRYEEMTISIDCYLIGITDEERLVTLIETTEEGINLAAEIYHTSNGILTITLPKISSVIIKNTKEY